MGLQLACYLLGSLILTFMPIPQILLWCWPNWIVLFFVWLSYFRPQLPILLFVWGLGLILDTLQATYLGVHVFALTILNLFLNHYKSKFLAYTSIQQVFVVFLACMIYLFCSQFAFVDMTVSYFMIYAVLISFTTALLWPWLEMYIKSHLIALNKSKFRGDIYGV
jgi:rod shape-determining protein MreD